MLIWTGEMGDNNQYSITICGINTITKKYQWSIDSMILTWIILTKKDYPKIFFFLKLLDSTIANQNNFLT